MDIADSLAKKVLSWLDLHEKGAEKMNQLASEHEKHKENIKIHQVVGISVTVGVAIGIIVAGILTFCTGGAVLPLIVAAGAVASGLGVTTNVGSTAVEAILSSLSMKEAKQIGEDIQNVVSEIEKHTDMLNDEWKKNQTEDDLCFDSSEDHAVEHILRAMAKDHGLQINGHIKLSNVLKALHCEDAAGHLLKESGQCFSLLSQFVRQTISTAALKKVAKDAGLTAAAEGLGKAAASIASGAVGLLFSVPDLIRNSTRPGESNLVTESSQSLRKTATTLLNSSEPMREELNEIRKQLQKLSDLKNIIGNPARNDDEKKLLMRFAMKHCRDEATRQWLREKSESFSKLVDMFSLLQKQIDEEEKKNHSDRVDITFVAHGSIEDQMIPAKFLLPLDSLHDVVLYSPWNCFLTADAAYDIATGNMEPQDRDFCCMLEYCNILKKKHRPRKLPNEWNSMKKTGDKKIPNIMLSPLHPSKNGAWKSIERLEDKYGRPGRNHILIPFIITEGKEYDIPFFVVSLALSLVLMFSRFQVTLHLTACLGKARKDMKLDEDTLEEQYACTLDGVGMDSSVKRSQMRNEELYTNLKTLFGERSSGYKRTKH